MYVVSIMPCTAKKLEAGREEMCSVEEIPDVDAVLTTREAAQMMREMGVELPDLPDDASTSSAFDEPLGHKSHKLLHTKYTRRSEWPTEFDADEETVEAK